MKHSVIARGLFAVTAILVLTGCMRAHQHYQQTLIMGLKKAKK